MSNRAEHDDNRPPDGRAKSARNVRIALAAACAAIGAAAMYFSVLILYDVVLSSDIDLPLFDASTALWPAGMILILVALIVQPPGRARIYTRAAFLLVVLAAVLSHLFVSDLPFPARTGWWYDWFSPR